LSIGVHTWRCRSRTNESLKEAQSLYRNSGYVEVDPFNDEPYAHHWFEKHIKRQASTRRCAVR